jgi:hypothetical protein
MSTTYNTAIKNANVDLTKKNQINAKKRQPKSYLTLLNTTSIINKSLILVQQGLNNLNTNLIDSDIILGPEYFYNLQIPNKIIDILKDDRLANITLNATKINLNFGIIPYEFINGIKITNATGGEQTINLGSVQTIFFPYNSINSIPGVNKIKFSSNSKAGETIDIIWYNAPFINLLPGYRVITSSTNIEYHTV